MELDLKRKSALITGGSKGIGFAAARAFAAANSSGIGHAKAGTTSAMNRSSDCFFRSCDMPLSIQNPY